MKRICPYYKKCQVEPCPHKKSHRNAERCLNGTCSFVGGSETFDCVRVDKLSEEEQIHISMEDL